MASDVDLQLLGFRHIVCWSYSNILACSAVIFLALKIPTVIYTNILEWLSQCWFNSRNVTVSNMTATSLWMVSTTLQQREGMVSGGYKWLTLMIVLFIWGQTDVQCMNSGGTSHLKSCCLQLAQYTQADTGKSLTFCSLEDSKWAFGKKK
jgi:hypothetical protein